MTHSQHEETEIQIGRKKEIELPLNFHLDYSEPNFLSIAVNIERVDLFANHHDKCAGCRSRCHNYRGSTMKVHTLMAIEIAENQVLQGSFIDISEDILPHLQGKVAYSKDGTLFVPRHVHDLASLIVGLTTEDLALQKQLLMRHCQAYDRKNIHNKCKECEKRAAAMERDKGISREEAELEAAKELNLLAFLDDPIGPSHQDLDAAV